MDHSVTRSFFANILNDLVILLSSILTIALLVLAVLRTTVEQGNIQSEAAKKIIASVYPSIVVLVLLLCFLLIIVLRNRGTRTPTVVAIGVVFAVAAALSIVLGFFFTKAVELSPVFLRDVFVGTNGIFSNLLIIFALISFAIAVFLISAGRGIKRSSMVEEHE